jgi:cold shock CspA family protein
MGRSQETFNKKDKEKNKLKKRQDKLAKKEERKANAKDGSLESMMAYVDEFGNITDTPIDPKMKKAISAEDIEIGIPKREIEENETIREGKVSYYNSDKGYGFIRDAVSQESIFVHVNAVSGTIAENDKVSFERVKGPKGWNAVNVKKK